ncbi:MAG: hypothetical protein MPJ24_01855 [Pirellulaceae bacterium]|nr:hypothetical protein [Pirellulaceae bacterium]
MKFRFPYLCRLSLLITFSALSVTGCSESVPAGRYEVSGAVLVKGEEGKWFNGQLDLTNVEKGGTNYSTKIENGEYGFLGSNAVNPGKYTVSISSFDPRKEKAHVAGHDTKLSADGNPGEEVTVADDKDDEDEDTAAAGGRPEPPDMESQFVLEKYNFYDGVPSELTIEVKDTGKNTADFTIELKNS